MRQDIYKIIKTEKVENEGILRKKQGEMHPFVRDVTVILCGGYVIVDFGKELCGRLHIVFGGNTNGEFRVRLGESVAETCAELGEKYAGNYHSIRDCVYPIVSYSDFSTNESGFRFARIDVPNGEFARITEIFAEATPNGLEEMGDLLLSDTTLDAIYKTAKRTTTLCVRQNSIWDGIKRDRVAWMGDFYPELISAFAVYGDIPQMKAVLNMIKDYDGCWVNYIPSYSAWWIICLEKYYRLTADIDYVGAMLPYIDKVLQNFDIIIKEDGSVSYKDSKLKMFESNEFFFDWPTNLTADSEIAWRYLITYAMQKAKCVYELFNKKCDMAEDLIKRLDKYIYKPSKFKQVTAIGVLCGRIEKEQALPLLKENGTEGMTTFMGCLIIEALQKLGEGEYALWLIKEYYSKMLQLGATTFWEDFDVNWLKEDPLPLDALPDKNRKNIHADFGKFCYTGLRHSLCHGWSSGFIEFLNSYVLGVQQTKAGYKEIKVVPHLCGLNRVEGFVPTKYGIIKVIHQFENGKIKTMVEVPNGVTVV